MSDFYHAVLVRIVSPVCMVHHNLCVGLVDQNHRVVAIIRYFITIYSCAHAYSIEVAACSAECCFAYSVSIVIISPQIAIYITRKTCAFGAIVVKGSSIRGTVSSPVAAHRPICHRDDFTVYGVGIAAAGFPAGRR